MMMKFAFSVFLTLSLCLDSATARHKGSKGSNNGSSSKGKGKKSVCINDETSSSSKGGKGKGKIKLDDCEPSPDNETILPVINMADFIATGGLQFDVQVAPGTFLPLDVAAARGPYPGDLISKSLCARVYMFVCSKACMYNQRRRSSLRWVLGLCFFSTWVELAS